MCFITDTVDHTMWCADDCKVKMPEECYINGIKYVQERTCSVKASQVDIHEMSYSCSVCGMSEHVIKRTPSVFDYSYCPNCGAKIVGD